MLSACEYVIQRLYINVLVSSNYDKKFENTDEYISLFVYNIFSSPHKYVCHSLNKYMMGKVVRLPVYIVFENVGLVICLDTGTCF